MVVTLFSSVSRWMVWQVDFNSKVNVQPKIWDGKASKAAGRSTEAHFSSFGKIPKGNEEDLVKCKYNIYNFFFISNCLPAGSIFFDLRKAVIESHSMSVLIILMELC